MKLVFLIMFYCGIVIRLGIDIFGKNVLVLNFFRSFVFRSFEI